MIKNNVKKAVLFILLFFSSVFLLHISINANAKPMYSVNPLFSNLPVERGSSYFNLNVEPYTHYTVPLLLTNNTDKSVITENFVRGSATSDNGSIVYDVKKAPLLSHITNNGVKKFILPAHTSKIINYNIYTAQNLFYGTQLAAIITHFYLPNKKSMNNSVNYINGLSLTERNVKPDVNRLQKTNLLYDDHNNSYKLRIKNDMPVVFNKLSAKVTAHGDINKSFKFKDIGIAPNSSFDFVLPIKQRGIKLDDIVVNFNDYNMKDAHKRSTLSSNKFINLKNPYFIICISLILIFLLFSLRKEGKK